MRSQLLWAAFAILALVVLVQLFRYDYVHTTGQIVMRVDRLTGASCSMPCQPIESGPVDDRRATVSIGLGSSGYDAKCGMIAFDGMGLGILRILKGPVPSAADQLEADFSAPGVHEVVNETQQSILLRGSVVYRSESWQSIEDQMRRFGCTTA